MKCVYFCVQITDQIKTLLQEKLQPYKIQIAKDAAKASMLVSEFEASVHTPAMVLYKVSMFSLSRCNLNVLPVVL